MGEHGALERHDDIHAQVALQAADLAAVQHPPIFQQLVPCGERRLLGGNERGGQRPVAPAQAVPGDLHHQAPCAQQAGEQPQFVAPLRRFLSPVGFFLGRHLALLIARIL